MRRFVALPMSYTGLQSCCENLRLLIRKVAWLATFTVATSLRILDIDAACRANGHMSERASQRDDSTIDSGEVARFAALASKWWDPEGAFKPLHRLNPVRLTYIRDQICRHFERDPLVMPCLQGLSVLDIGCGGGLLTEPMARLGATVTGIDPAGESITAAREHADGQHLDITYRADRAETLVDEGMQFDAVTLMEVVEHVPDVPAFVQMSTKLVRPGGVMILSTINRTLKSYAMAIIGAEYVLRWLPVGTHKWDRLVTPEELSQALSQAGLACQGTRGMMYNPLQDGWSLAADTDVNYLMTATKPPQA